MQNSKLKEKNCRTGLGFSEDGDDVFDFYDKKAIVTLKIDGDGAFWIEEDLVILLQRQFGGDFDLGGDGDNSACDGWNLDVIGQLDAAFGLLFVLVFANEDSFADRLNGFKGPGLCVLLLWHLKIILTKIFFRFKAGFRFGRYSITAKGILFFLLHSSSVLAFSGALLPFYAPVVPLIGRQHIYYAVAFVKVKSFCSIQAVFAGTFLARLVFADFLPRSSSACSQVSGGHFPSACSFFRLSS